MSCGCHIIILSVVPGWVVGGFSALDEIVVFQEGSSEPDHPGWVCVQVVWKVDIGAAMGVFAFFSILASAISSCPEDADKVVATNSPVSGLPIVLLIVWVPVDVSVGQELPRSR